MTVEAADLVLRVAAILATLVATLVALFIATRGRQAAARQARLTIELTTARRLVEVLAQYRDPSHVFREGVAGYHDLPALAAVLGPTRVPTLWQAKFVEERKAPDRSTVAIEIQIEGFFPIELGYLDEATAALEGIVAEQRASERSRRPWRRAVPERDASGEG